MLGCFDRISKSRKVNRIPRVIEQSGQRANSHRANRDPSTLVLDPSPASVPPIFLTLMSPLLGFKIDQKRQPFSPSPHSRFGNDEAFLRSAPMWDLVLNWYAKARLGPWSLGSGRNEMSSMFEWDVKVLIFNDAEHIYKVVYECPGVRRCECRSGRKARQPEFIAFYVDLRATQGRGVFVAFAKATRDGSSWEMALDDQAAIKSLSQVVGGWAAWPVFLQACWKCLPRRTGSIC